VALVIKEIIININVCEGCFCASATCRAKGDHNVDLSLEKRESNPKFNRGLKVRPKG
jgi:predicted nucleic acid binding AN1-type Zn finger protein